MSDYNILFYLYLSIVCLLLFVFAVFVSLQLKSLFFYFLFFIEGLSIDRSNFVFSMKLYQNFYYFHSTISGLSLFISLSELCLEHNLDNVDKKYIYFLLAGAYRDLSFPEISEYYYLKALSYDFQNVQIVSSLANMYNQLGYLQNAKKLYDSISNS